MAILTQQDLVDNLTITQTVIPQITHKVPGGIVQIVPIFQSVTAVIVPNPNRLIVNTTVGVSQSITLQKVKQVTTNLKVSQTLSRNIERRINITQPLAINQFVIAWFDYHVSGNDGRAFVDPIVRAYEAGLVAPAEITLTCVNADALPEPINITINLRKPEFGDGTSLQPFRIQRNSLGGDLQIFKDGMWPDTEEIKMSFAYLDEDKATELLQFLTKTLGQIMTLKDQFGNIFTGYISTPFEEILQPKVVGWSASFTFQKWEQPFA